MHMFTALAGAAALVACASATAALAADYDVKFATPLLVSPAHDHVEVKDHRSNHVLSERRISHLRSVQLSTDLVFHSKAIEYSLAAGQTLTGSVVLRPHRDDDFSFDDILHDSPEVRGLIAQGFKKKSPEVRAARARTYEKMAALLNLAPINEADISGFADMRWIYCGATNRKGSDGKSQEVSVCLNDQDADGVFDTAFTVTLQDLIGMSQLGGTPLPSEDLAVGYRQTGALETEYALLSVVTASGKTYTFNYGMGKAGSEKINLQDFDAIPEFRRHFGKKQPQDFEILGTRFQIVPVPKKKVNATVDSDGTVAYLARGFSLD